MYNAGHPKPVLCDNLEGWGGRWERGSGQGDIGFMSTYGKNHHNTVK